MYDEWCKLEQQKYETYTSAVQNFPPLEENKAFKPIKNAVINAILNIVFSEQILKTEISTDDENQPQERKENTNIQNQKQVQSAALSMLFSFGRLISDDYNRNLHGQKMRTEHKLKSAIHRKKQALGLKESPLEQKLR